MKNKTSFLILPIILFFFNPGNNAAEIIYSTSTGGNWNVTGTWEGGVIPSGSDDVIIRTSATVNAILGTYNSCNNFTVQENATLLFNGSGTATLTLNGSLVNNGTVRNGSGNLTLIIFQSVNFDGAEWSNYRVSFQGTANHQIVFGSGRTFAGNSFVVEGIPRQLNAGSDISFLNTIVDFNGSSLVMADNCKLLLSGQSLNDIAVSGAGNQIEMTGGAYLINSALTGSTLKGVIRIGGGAVNFYDQTVLNSGAVLENYGSSHTVYVNGSFINNGTVTNTSNFLAMHISGDVVNNGIWQNNETYLSGTSDQDITFAEGTVFTGSNFYNLNATSKTVYAQSDLTFCGTNINFASGSPGSVRGTLVMADKKKVILSGNGNAKYLSRLHLGSTGSEAGILLTNGAYLTSFSNNCSVLNLLGYVQIGNSEIYMANMVRVLDTLINYGGSAHTMYINGSLHNLGFIKGSTANLEIQVTGDIIHDGVEWSNYKVLLTGTNEREIAFAPFSTFDGPFFSCNSAISMFITTGLVFNTTQVNFFNSTISITGHKVIRVTGGTARLINAVINGDVTLDLASGAYIQGITFNNQLILPGNTQIYNTNVYCNEKVVNDGVLQNQNATAHTLYLNHDFYNNGTVENGAGMGNFILELKGNVIHDGTWQNYENRINGNTDQHIRLNKDKPINSKFVLYSNLGGSNFQWYKNSQPIAGATSVTLIFNQVTTAQYGIYYCVSSAGQSRLITVNTNPDVGFTADKTSGCQPMTVVFSDTTISGLPIQSWLWDFGDGATSTEQNPMHLFTGHGSFDVSLEVSDGYVTRDCLKKNLVVTEMTPVPDFFYENVCFGQPVHFEDLTIGYLLDEPVEIQYASEVISFSSQYSSGSWAAEEALGEPDVYPSHQDNVHAWASLTANNQREFLELGFAMPRHIFQVIIYETLYPGAVDSVYVKNPGTGQWELVWSGTAAPQPLEARALTLSFPLTEFLVNEVRIALNSPAVPYWNEIDAVAIVHPFECTMSDQTTYLWDMGENGVTFSTKGPVDYTFQDPGYHTVSLSVTNNDTCIATVSKPVYTANPSESTTWIGSADNNWHNAANWCPQVVPGPTTKVILPSVVNPINVQISSTASCRSLDVDQGVNLQVVNGVTLTVIESEVEP